MGKVVEIGKVESVNNNLGSDKKKMKKKIAVLIGIAFCTMLLISPALASGIDTLEIYGNANEDDTIDMRDLTYVKLIFFGKKPETELADAKYDGKINPLDFIQIKLIIVGKEKELTIIDSCDRIVTVKKLVERIVVLNGEHADAIRAVGAKDKIVGIGEAMIKMEKFFPELSKKESVGYWWTGPDVEKILELKPDVVMAFPKYPPREKLDDKLKGTDITIVRLSFCNPEMMREEMKILGYILGEKENADKYLEWQDSYVKEIKERVSGIPEDEKPKVFIDTGTKDTTSCGTCSEGSALHWLCVMAGGRNIAADQGTITYPYPVVETEWILKQNPDVIIGFLWAYGGGYDTDDKIKLKEHYDQIVRLPGFEKISAVENKRVYTSDFTILIVPAFPVGFTYAAKWLHPELFEDLDPQAIHQEYIDEFCGIDFDVSEHGVFVYHPELYPDGR